MWKNIVQGIVVGFVVFVVMIFMVEVFFIRLMPSLAGRIHFLVGDVGFLLVPFVVGVLVGWLRVRAKPKYLRVWNAITWTLVGVVAGFILSIMNRPYSLTETLLPPAVVGFASGLFAWGVTQPTKPIELPPPLPYMTLYITVPPISWEPTQAVGVMNALFPLASIGPITFRILATSTDITWTIVLPQESGETVKRAIRSFYPQAEIESTEETPVDHPETTESNFLTELRGGAEYFAPLRAVVDQNDLDPLTGIVGAMAQLEEGEQVAYAVTIKPAERDYRQEGRKKIHHSKTPGLVLGTLSAAVGNRPLIVTGQRSLDKYEARFQKAFEEKLDSLLLPVTMAVSIRAYDLQRRVGIRDSIVTATSMFDQPQGNALTNQPQGHPLILSAQEVASLWHLPSEDIRTPGVVRSSGAKAPLPVELIQQKSGLLLGYNTYQGKTLPVYLAQADRITHMNITGKTRVGKTTFLHNLIHQDIAQGRGVGVIDPHGDLIQNILACSIPPEREKDVVLFDLADVAHPVALNLLYVPPGVQRHAAVGLTMGVLKKLFADQWSATRMEDALYSALAVLVDSAGTTIRDIPKLFNDSSYRTQILARSSDTVALEYWRDDYERMGERYQLEVARPIMHRIRTFYRNPVIERMVVQPVSLDFRSMMDEGKIFLASLAGEATQAESAIIGALLISKLQLAAMSRAQIPVAQRRMFYLYVDEVQNFITTSLSTMFSEAAKYALSLTVANQYLSQLEGGTLEAVIGNTGTIVMFASGNQDAQDLGAYIKPTFDSQTLLNLDRFQTIVKMQHGGKTLPAFSMQTPPPPTTPTDASVRVRRIREQAQTQSAPAAEVADQADEEGIDLTALPNTETDAGTVPDLEL